MNELEHSLPLTEAVNTLLDESEVPASLTLEQCSSLLAMSMTSFRRKLAQEETSYKLIQSKFLNELCVSTLLTKKIKIDDLAIKLGYSERATFERAFRQKFGVTPSQFRVVSLVDNDCSCHKKLIEIAEDIPPMSSSCKELLDAKESDELDVQKTVEIVSKDAIFSARIMGLASKAIYGKTPNNLSEAISRNLGINTVINVAIIYAVKDALQDNVDPIIIEQYSEIFLIAPKFFQLIRKSLSSAVEFDIPLTEQVLTFALLGVFLLAHKSAYKHELMLYSLRGISDLQSLNCHLRELMQISIYSSSSLMLSMWHIDVSLVKQLNHIEKISQVNGKRSEQDELVLFMLSCLYFSATGHEDFSELSDKAELLNIKGFADIKEQVFDCSL
ncbi:AraC family transcriptional regulator [Colwellia sp. 1_MG-2023]|jgi:HD-like signal output (HDOD) protein/AraC-like DNA-binding protein|uniref:AraC family transcriptional regulator n=1 Tax=unclassified Colwellia TaxID=196834 RepID=UPI001C08B299|nr:MULTISPECIES: AraC family transcriptional regulator [unclassified Colwellia]MBU2924420.1 AraC family transcriptional regulator [Colwellia sp. C2M11]MDO6653080.1 AraC family transcriptional regulator [Colwellia sp. 3_MG-2023]MDO6665933.1 AraC family transcriptional regulator [Colwellia sp. 2_MG-2023]MDO6690306.1 AraC family transcriptional regulator [Colwellia sp. 1_MG-2023]